MTATEPFVELLTPTKTERNRVLRWEPDADGMWRIGRLTIEDSRDTTVYEVDESAADVGRSFTLRKPAGGFYCVEVRGLSSDSCQCARFMRTGLVCRHVEAVRALINNGQL
jgi:hypothetical protein